MSKSLSNKSFDYSSLSKDDKGKMIYFEADVQKRGKRMAEDIVQWGESLQSVQQILANYSGGVFVAWLEYMGISTRSAYRAIDLYVEFGSFANWQNLEVSAAYELAKHPTAKTGALKLVDKGVKVTHAMAKELIAASETRSKKGEPAGDVSSSLEAPQAVGMPESAPAAAFIHEEPIDVEFTIGEEEEPAEEPLQENSPESPRNGKERTESPGDLARKNRELAHAYRDKLARAICDYHEVKPNRSERDRLVKLVQSIELWAVNS